MRASALHKQARRDALNSNHDSCASPDRILKASFAIQRVMFSSIIASSFLICVLYAGGIWLSDVLFIIPTREATTSSGDILKVSISERCVHSKMAELSFHYLLQKLVEADNLFAKVEEANLKIAFGESIQLLFILKQLFAKGSASSQRIIVPDAEEGSPSRSKESDTSPERSEEAGSQEEPTQASPAVPAPPC